MYERRRRITVRLLSLLISATAIGFVADPCESAELSVRSDRVRSISRSISEGDFDAAVDSCRQLIGDHPANPIGPLLLGVTYQSIGSQYRNERYADSVAHHLDSAIALARAAIERNKDDAGLYFVLGSAYGCRALFRSSHGGWAETFKDGQRSCHYLEKAYKLDSSFTDALAGIGAYHYWVSAKANVLRGLPSIGDKRKQGIAEIRRSIEAGGIMAVNAERSLLPILLDQGQFGEVVIVTDSLSSQHALDPNSLLNRVRALIELKRWDDAEAAIDEALAQYKESDFSDECGSQEAVYLKATILAGKDDREGAREYALRVIARDSTCHGNTYFRKTIENARELLK